MTPPRQESVDVLVVGAGPAGISAAKAAAEGGASVLLVDAKSEIGLPVCCAEFVPRLMARELDIPDEAVAQSVDDMIFFVTEETATSELGRVRSPGFILHRERLESCLARSAVEAGCELATSTRAKPGPDGTVYVVRENRVRCLRPAVVVAADGPFSIFRPAEEEKPCLPAVQFTLPLARRTNGTEIHFRRELRSGYAWLFPKGDLANVGLGCAPPGDRRELFPLLEAFVGDLRRAGKLAAKEPVRRAAGWIPTWGPPETALRVGDGRNVLFAGDAGGFTDPLSGAGFWPAILTGRLAGRCAGEAASQSDWALLSQYDEEWRGHLGSALTRSAAARKKLDSEWDSRKLSELVRETWPGLRRADRPTPSREAPPVSRDGIHASRGPRRRMKMNDGGGSVS
jgi:geranylgeranyl reductase family protein